MDFYYIINAYTGNKKKLNKKEVIFASTCKRH